MDAAFVHSLLQSHPSHHRLRRVPVDIRPSRCLSLSSGLEDNALNTTVSIPSMDGDGNGDDTMALYRAQNAFSILARQGKAWKRLSHIVEMALTLGENDSSLLPTTPALSNTTIVDVGTDHGLLAIGLALTGRYRKVIGIDVSENALENALSLLGQVKGHSFSTGNRNVEEMDHSLCAPIDFRCGNGLQALDNGEGTVVCIAGMGVKSIIQILEQSRSCQGRAELELDRVRCKQLILQPTNSKPRNLIALYKKLQEDGWEVSDERIEVLSSRWYMTTKFERRNFVTSPDDNFNDDYAGNSLTLPGDVLSSSRFPQMYPVFDSYCQHHERWILRDAAFGPIHPLETEWLRRFGDQETTQ